MKPLIPELKMNKTERAYAQYLELRKQAGEIVSYRFEPMGLKLAEKTFYHPDFLVVCRDHFQFHEVKGFWRDDARVKIKVAAQRFPWFKFLVIKRVSGSWEMEQV